MTLTGMLQDRLDAIPRTDDWGVAVADLLLRAAHERGCSDLHILPRKGNALASVRTDGHLTPVATIPEELTGLLTARLKVLARLPAFVRHKPQDGRLEWQPEEDSAPLLLRASFVPSLHGESVLIRFPEQHAAALTLSQLGMSAEVFSGAQAALAGPEGVILLTGPAGSGKTTTLYAMLDHIHRYHGERVHVLTIEDPVERDLGFATQIQVNDARDLGFHEALRAGLRQDPNVILIGEIRDPETARITMQAGLSGHLVLSTIHSGRAARVPGRLLSLGVEPWLLSSALTAAMAQRLARRLCTACRRPDERSEGHWVAGEGCTECNQTGHHGRVALFESLQMNEALRDLVTARAATDQFLRAAAGACVGSLAESARTLLCDGVISRAELEQLLPGEVTLS